MSTPSAQILVSKYHSPVCGTSTPWRNSWCWDLGERSKMSLKSFCIRKREHKEWWSTAKEIQEVGRSHSHGPNQVQFQLLHISPTLVSFAHYVYNDHPNGCEVVSYCSFDVHFLNDQWCWASFHVLISHYISLEKCLLEPFIYFWITLFVLY